jgi:hypothetical protein
MDEDAVVFQLVNDKGRLVGYGRKLRKDSPNLSAIFVKQK